MSNILKALNLKLSSVQDYIGLGIAILSFLLSLFLALHLDIYGDEAYTYLNTGRLRNVWSIIQFRLANTHALCSIMMSVSTLFFPFSIIAIRLPAILFAAFYAMLSLSISSRFKYRLLGLGLFLFFDQLILFHSLGRGYGMCATLVLAAIFVYDKKDQIQKWPVLIGWILIASVYANFVVMPLVGVFALYILIVDLKRDISAIPKKVLRWWGGLLLFAFYGFILVSLGDKPLYGAYEAGFMDSVPRSLMLHFTTLVTPSLQAVTVITIVFALLLVLQFAIEKENPYGILLIITFSIIYLSSIILHKPLPTGRVLVPFWPLIVVSFIKLLEFLTNGINPPVILSRIAGIALAGWLGYNALDQFKLAEIYTGKKTEWLIPLNALYDQGQLKRDADQFYSRRDLYLDIIPKRLENRDAETLYEDEDYRVKYYQKLGIYAIYSSIPEDNLISLQVIRTRQNEHEIITDTVYLKERYHFRNKRVFLLPNNAYHANQTSYQITDLNGQLTSSADDNFKPREANIILWRARPEMENSEVGTNTPIKENN
jgi:hypothetical protein